MARWSASPRGRYILHWGSWTISIESPPSVLDGENQERSMKKTTPINKVKMATRNIKIL